MVLNFAKSLVKKGASAAAGAVADRYHQRNVRKKFEAYFKGPVDHRDPFMFAKAITSEPGSASELDDLQNIELLEACASLLVCCLGISGDPELQSDNSEKRHKYIQTFFGGNRDTDAVRGLIADVKTAIDKLAGMDLSTITKAPMVKINFEDWLKDMKEEVFSNLDKLLDRAAYYEAGKLELKDHLEAFTDKLDEAEVNNLIGENQAKIVDLYKAMSDAFRDNDLVELNRLAAVPKDVNRINQIETIIDLYTLKMRRVNEDSSLTDHEREVKLASWQSLMEADIQALGGAN